MNTFRNETLQKIILPLAVVSGLGTLATGCSEGVNNNERVITVCDKERVFSNGDSEYRVYTADSSGDSHTYRVVDTFIVGGTRFDTADTYGSIDRGTTYSVESSGYRVGILSQFPNIIDLVEVTEQHPEWCE